MDRKIQLLKNISILSQLNTNEMTVFSSLCEFSDFQKDSIIFKTGDKSNSFYIVDSGEIRIINNAEDNKENVLACFLPGEIFGEFDLFEGDLRTATAITNEDTRILVFPKHDIQFDAIYKHYSDIFAMIYYNLITINAGRIRQTNRLVSEKNKWIEELKHQMHVDKLTGFYNRTFLQDELPDILKQNNNKATIIVVKPDKFKIVNDNFGHEAGDVALRAISQTVRSHLQENEIPVRFRGNEFIAIYLNTELDKALEKAKELHSVLNSIDIGKLIGDKSLKLTYSMGIACYPDHGDDFNGLIDLAYTKLFEQMDNGGNGILTADASKSEEAVLNFLRTVNILSTLYISELKKIAGYFRPLNIKINDILCREGEIGNELFVIESGRAAVKIKLQDGSEKEIADISSGDFFGEIAIFENQKRSATCAVVQDGKIYKLNKNDFLTIMNESPVIAIKIMQKMLDITTNRISNTGRFISEMVKWGEEASRRAVTDELTGLYNRRYLDSSLEELFNKSRQENKYMSLIMADMDYFREVNEGYSHEIGDKYIVEVAKIFREYFRKTDIIARFGGDEFTIILPETMPREAGEIAEKIRSSVEKLDFLKQYKGPALNLSVSQGIACYPENCDNLNSLKELADKALYKAKEGGRNRVVISE